MKKQSKVDENEARRYLIRMPSGRKMGSSELTIIIIIIICVRRSRGNFKKRFLKWHLTDQYEGGGSCGEALLFMIQIDTPIQQNID